MKKAIIYPGRFQPMLPHHAEVYRRLQSTFPDADVFVATSDKVDPPKSPFQFSEKVQIMQGMHGIPKDKILIAPQPYLVDSFKDKFDTENTMVIFAVGEKDNDRFPMKNIDPDTGLDMTVRGDPRPKYYQMINTLKTDPPMSMNDRGYIYNAPSIEGLDGEVASASAFREAFTSVDNEQQQRAIFEKYMGTFNENIFALFKNKLIGDKMKESINELRRLAGLSETAPVDFDDEPAMDDDDDEGLKPGFAQKDMVTQLSKVADSEDVSKDADAMKVKKFSKITSVTTDDGDDVELSGAEAKALLKMFNMLSSQSAGEEQSPRERFIRAIQTTKGLDSMTAFAKAKGLVEETAEDQPMVNFDDIRDDYSVEEAQVNEETYTFAQVKAFMKAVGDKDWATVKPEDSEIFVRSGKDGDIMFSDAGAGEYETFDWDELDAVRDHMPDRDAEEDEAVEEEIDEVAGPKDCWPGHKKVGTQPGTGKNKGKRVNKCVKEEDDDEYEVEEGRRGKQALMPGGKVYVGRGEVAHHDDYGWMARGIDEDDFHFFDTKDEALDYVASYRVAKPNAIDDYKDSERRRRHLDAEPRVSAPRFKDDPEDDDGALEETTNIAMAAALEELKKLAGI